MAVSSGYMVSSNKIPINAFMNLLPYYILINFYFTLFYHLDSP